jgi:hypothetical protein
MISRRIGAATAVVLTSMVLASCFSSVSVPMYQRLQPGLSDLAGLQGELRVIDHCLVVGETYVAWPSPGTTWLPASQSLSVDGHAMTVGDHIQLAGGEITAGAAFEWVVKPERHCLRASLFAVGSVEEVTRR